MDCEPLVALLPDQPPDAVQEVALVVDHDRVELGAARDGAGARAKAHGRGG